MSDDKPKIHIDSDWKAEAQAEKQRLAEQEAQQAEAGASGGGQLPPADFQTLISTMVTQTLFAMGAVPDPQTGQRMVHLELAKHHIDMLGVIADKTKGNLSEDESQMLTEALKELRQNFVYLVEQVKAHQAKQAMGGAPGSSSGKGSAKPGPGIIDPSK